MLPPVRTDDATIARLLDRGTVDVIVRDQLTARLRSGERLRVKLGIDPTKPDIHLGHTVPLRKLRQFQDAGHQAVLIIGGFTATIGDPTGKNEARPPLTLAEVAANGQSYIQQASRVLDTTTLEVRNNADWLAALTPEQFVQLMGQFTVAQMMERDMFRQRADKGQPVYCHEILYPIMQGYDSVAVQADIELGGTDQLFNLLQGRPLQTHDGQSPQHVITVPLIEGLDGSQKMSKSLGNYIALDDTPSDMFGKTMKLPDRLMGKYFELLTDVDLPTAEQLIADSPRQAKSELAKAIITHYYSAEAATTAEAAFLAQFRDKAIPTDIPEFALPPDASLITVLTTVTSFASSSSEARRLITGGGVSINGQKITDVHAPLPVSTTPLTLKCGKRKWAKLISR